MKKLSILLLALCLLPLPRASASLEDMDITDYLDFPVGTWWSYSTTDIDHVNDTTEQSTELITQVECVDTEHTPCYSTEDETGRTTLYVEDNIAYLSEISGETPSQNYKNIDLQDFTIMIDEEDYDLLEMTDFEPAAEISCGYEADADYSYNGYTAEALIEHCALIATHEDGFGVEMFSTSTSLPGLGEVLSSLTVYLGEDLAWESTTMLTATNLLEDEESPFSDVDVDHKNYNAIKYLYDLEIVGGYSDGTFRPDNSINRAELIKVLVEGQGVSPDGSNYRNCFTDVTTDWYAKYVCYAEEEGWISGHPDGSFRPGDPVNKVEALKMMLLSQEITISDEWTVNYTDVNSADWFAPYIQTASEMGLLEESGVFFRPSHERDRKGVAENLYRLLTYLED